MVLQEGSETLPRCDMCGIHIPEGRLIKNWRMVCFLKNTEKRIRRKDVEVTSQCAEIEINLAGKEGVEKIEGLNFFADLGQPLD